ncbi:MAG: hypothetical protein M3017_05460 [Actinomycetota bacterium]|nr:hypothetical protein [Actinomycetota bacterium]
MSTYETAHAWMAHDDGEPVQILEIGASTAADAGAREATGTSGRARDEKARRANPFVIALWVLCAALTGLSAVALYASYSLTMLPSSVATQTNVHPAWFYLVAPLAYLLVPVSLLTLAGLLILHAVLWDRRVPPLRG